MYESPEYEDKVLCLKCDLDLAKSTTTISRHLESLHKILRPSSKNEQPDPKQMKLEKFSTSSAEKETIQLSAQEKKSIDYYLTMAIASSSAPNTFIQNKYLREGLHMLNNSYKPLSRNQVSSNIDALYSNLISKIQLQIDGLKHFSLCIDFW